MFRSLAKIVILVTLVGACGAAATPTECAGLVSEFTKGKVRRLVDQGLNVGIVVGVVVLTNTFHDVDEIGLHLLRYAASRP